MRVMITTRVAEEWYALCQGVVGHQLRPERTFMMATAPGQHEWAGIYEITGPVATWIELRHPGWILKETV